MTFAELKVGDKFVLFFDIVNDSTRCVYEKKTQPAELPWNALNLTTGEIHRIPADTKVVKLAS